MLRIKNSLIKKAIAAGLMIATVMGKVYQRLQVNGILTQADMQSTTFIKTDALMKVFL